MSCRGQDGVVSRSFVDEAKVSGRGREGMKTSFDRSMGELLNH